MDAFSWGMVGLLAFFTLVFVWSLYSYKARTKERHHETDR